MHTNFIIPIFVINKSTMRYTQAQAIKAHKEYNKINWVMVAEFISGDTYKCMKKANNFVVDFANKENISVEDIFNGCRDIEEQSLNESILYGNFDF